MSVMMIKINNNLNVCLKIYLIFENIHVWLMDSRNKKASEPESVS